MPIDIQSIVVCSDNGKIIEGNWTTVNDMVMKFTTLNGGNFSEPKNIVHIHYIVAENGNYEKASVVLEINNINQTNHFLFDFYTIAFTNRLDDVKDIVIKPIGDKIISFEWTDLMLDEQSFERYQFYVDNVLMMDSFENNVSFTPQTMGQHTYKVLAVNNMGIATRATSDSVRTLKLSDVLNQPKTNTKVERPLNVRRTNRNNAVVISWDAPRNNSNITSYWVFFEVNGKNKRVKVVANNKAKTQSTTFYYLNPNVNYEVFVVSVDKNNNTSIGSNSVFTKQTIRNNDKTMATTNRVRLLPPTNIRYEMITERKIRIYWNATSNNVDSYVIHSKTSEETKSIKKIKVFDSKQTTYSFNYEIPWLNTSYLFYITSASSSGVQSNSSETISVLIKKDIVSGCCGDDKGETISSSDNLNFLFISSVDNIEEEKNSLYTSFTGIYDGRNATNPFSLKLNNGGIAHIPSGRMKTTFGGQYKYGYWFKYFDSRKGNVGATQIIPFGYVPTQFKHKFNFVGINNVVVVTKSGKGMFVAGEVNDKSLSRFFVDLTRPPYNLIGADTDSVQIRKPRWVLPSFAEKVKQLDSMITQLYGVKKGKDKIGLFEETYRLFISSAYRPNYIQASYYYDYYFLRRTNEISPPNSPFLSAHTTGSAVDVSVVKVRRYFDAINKNSQSTQHPLNQIVIDRYSLKKDEKWFHRVWNLALPLGFENAGQVFSKANRKEAKPDAGEGEEPHLEIPLNKL